MGDIGWAEFEGAILRRALIFGFLALQGCKTVSENPVLIETVQKMEPLRSLELPQNWTPIKNRYVWDELQFVYPATNRLIPEYRTSDCTQAFLHPQKENIQEGRLGNAQFHSCIGRLIGQSGSDAAYQKVFVQALLNWSSMERDPWRQIPKRPYNDAKPYWYQSTSNFSVVATWYAINRNSWPITDQQRAQLDQYFQDYFQWADFDTPTESGRISCSIGNPAATAKQRVSTDTCGSVRMKGATATLALALATNHQPTYEKALQHMAVIFHQYDDEGFFVPYMAAQKQGWSFSYYFEAARFLSAWVELYATVGIDLLAYRMPSGVSVEQALHTAYRVTQDHKLLGKYTPDSNFNYGGNPNSSWADVKKLSQDEFEQRPNIYGAWDFEDNDARFALHNPRFAVEKLGLAPSWEDGYDGFHHSDFHAFQPVHLYLANKIDPRQLNEAVGKFDGEYRVEWSIRNINTGVWETVSQDQLIIEKGNGSFSAQNGAPGSPQQRRALTFVVDPLGKIRVKGTLGLFDAKRSYETRLSGTMAARVFQGVWHDGDGIRGKLTKID